MSTCDCREMTGGDTRKSNIMHSITARNAVQEYAASLGFPKGPIESGKLVSNIAANIGLSFVPGATPIALSQDNGIVRK